jgi:hypothetical protein
MRLKSSWRSSLGDSVDYFLTATGPVASADKPTATLAFTAETPLDQ